MLEVAENLERRPRLDDFAGAHDGDLVGDAGNDGEVVGDEDEPQPILVDETFEERQHLRLRGDVERRGRLVGDDQLGSSGDGHGNDHALTLAARELVRVAVAPELCFRQTDAVEGFGGNAFGLGARHGAVDAHGFADLVADGHERIERRHRLLENHADIAAAHLAHRRARACR
jgi:hypothetical protein